MKKITLFSTIILLLGAIYGTSNAQEKFKNRYAIGINYNPQWQIEGNYKEDIYYPSFGISAEAQFNKIIGFELGIYYWDYMINEINGPIPTARLLSFWGGGKIYTKIVNFSMGVTFDWSFKSEDRWNGDRFGVYLAVGKDIRLYKGLIFEPSVRLNPMQLDKKKHGDNFRTNLSFGLRLKYQF